MKKFTPIFLIMILMLLLPSNASAGTYRGVTLKRGDILLTNGTSDNGLFGHAAILNGNYHVLDAPGYGYTTRQSTIADWMNIYINKRKGTVWVYRVSKNGAGDLAGKWADLRYYSSKGTFVQDRFPTYSLNAFLGHTSLKRFDYMYCSKIVFQAYYYGTGSLPVMTFPLDPYMVIAPFALQNWFNKDYEPTLIATFKP